MTDQEKLWHNVELQHIPYTLAGHDMPWVLAARQSALERFTMHGFPTRHEEEWKYTDVSIIDKRNALTPDHIPPDPSFETKLLAWALAKDGIHLMVFVNGHYAPSLSSSENLTVGARLESLANILDYGADFPENLFDKQHEHTVFSTLNNAFATDGVVLHLAPGTVLEAPIYLLFIASGRGVAIYPRNIVVAGDGASATVIEHYIGTLDSHNFTNAVTQISLGAKAKIEHCKLLQEGPAASHIAGIHAEQASNSHFTSHSFSLGGRLVRNDITAQLLGNGCHCTMNGLYLLDDRQHMDQHTRIDHIAPEGTSREHYRGILNGNSQGVFNGKVVVHPTANKTDAHQSNHNLLLSRQAEMDTKPQLEIFADDVKCTHGATVGQLDEDSLFYLNSRGIDAALARSMLIYGFANDIIGRVAVPDLRTRIENMVLERLPQGDQIKELL